MLRDRTAIVGIGQTPFAKQLPDSETELAAQAVLAALDDAKISPDEVDGLVSYTIETTSDVDLARNLGFGDVGFFAQVGYGGGAGCGAVGLAAMAVASGQCRVAVAWRSRKRGATTSRPWVQAGLGVPEAPGGIPRVTDWYRAAGMLRPVDQIAMLARRYMHEFGATRDHLAEHRAGSARPRQPQPQRGDVQPAVDPRRVHGLALDLGAALHLRQLPGVRRRARGRDHVGRARRRTARTRRRTSMPTVRDSRARTR